ncbi:hypothetical protein BC827DRAFT_1193311, partial [Russula dissimulans]
TPGPFVPYQIGKILRWILRVFSQLNLRRLLSSKQTLEHAAIHSRWPNALSTSMREGLGLVDSMCATNPAGNGKIDAKSKRTTLGECPSIVKRVSRIAFHKLVFLISVPRVPVTHTEDLTTWSDIVGHAQPATQFDQSYSFTVNMIPSRDTTSFSRLALTGYRLEPCQYVPKPGPGWCRSC